MTNINSWNKRLLSRLEEDRMTHKKVELIWSPDHVKVIGFKEQTGDHMMIVGYFHDDQ